jgi:Zn-finger nucleic acid-binding protein
MPYREDLEAAHQRIALLEQRVGELRGVVERQRAEIARLGEELERARRYRDRDAATSAFYCPSCGGENPEGASSCRLCGERLRAAGVTGARIRCPGCDLATLAINVANLELRACEGCGGVWLDREQMQELVARSRSRTPLPDLSALDLVWDGSTTRQRKRYLRCPVCAEVMQHRAHGESEVVLDHCQAHGVWLDRGELSRILSWEMSGEVRPAPEVDQLAEPEPGGGPARSEAPEWRDGGVMDWLVELLRMR